MIIGYMGTKPRIGKDVLICDGAKVIGEVELGDNVSVWYNCVLRGDMNYIKVGKDTNIQDLTVVHIWHRGERSDGYPTVIGNGVTIGHNCIIHACTIGDNCLIGMGAIIMDNATVGDNSIVGAGSVITKNKKFPPNSVIIGNPARAVRELEQDEIEKIKGQAARYVQLARNYLNNA